MRPQHIPPKRDSLVTKCARKKRKIHCLCKWCVKFQALFEEHPKTLEILKLVNGSQAGSEGIGEMLVYTYVCGAPNANTLSESVSETNVVRIAELTNDLAAEFQRFNNTPGGELVRVLLPSELKAFYSDLPARLQDLASRFTRWLLPGDGFRFPNRKLIESRALAFLYFRLSFLQPSRTRYRIALDLAELLRTGYEAAGDLRLDLTEKTVIQRLKRYRNHRTEEYSEFERAVNVNFYPGCIHAFLLAKERIASRIF